MCFIILIFLYTLERQSVYAYIFCANPFRSPKNIIVNYIYFGCTLTMDFEYVSIFLYNIITCIEIRKTPFASFKIYFIYRSTHFERVIELVYYYYYFVRKKAKTRVDALFPCCHLALQNTGLNSLSHYQLFNNGDCFRLKILPWTAFPNEGNIRKGGWKEIHYNKTST